MSPLLLVLEDLFIEPTSALRIDVPSEIGIVEPPAEPAAWPPLPCTRSELLVPLLGLLLPVRPGRLGGPGVGLLDDDT